ncbi:MAG: fasciclin domain-containing protein [Sphingomicrobium sp.]|nr:fasciclin domain-containing protein [Sphingomonadales bacterium]
MIIVFNGSAALFCGVLRKSGLDCLHDRSAGVTISSQARLSNSLDWSCTNRRVRQTGGRHPARQNHLSSESVMQKRSALMGLAFALVFAAPAKAANIVETAKTAGNFTMLLQANKVAGTDKALMGKGPFTVFAPNDAAFAKVPKAKLDKLMKPGNRNMLKTALGAHLVTGFVTMQAIEKGLVDNDAVVVETVNKMPLVFKREGGMITVNGAHIVKPPMRVDNGIVYVIDTVLVPPMPLQPTY